jgi:hypothetical protein
MLFTKLYPTRLWSAMQHPNNTTGGCTEFTNPINSKNEERNPIQEHGHGKSRI